MGPKGTPVAGGSAEGKAATAVAESAPQNVALYPLTLFDKMAETSALGKSWVVEGLLDVEKLRGALDRIVAKWPMLAARVEVLVPRKRFQLRIPLGELPAGYKAYGLTSATSDVPLSHYTKIPLPAFSEYLPEHLFIAPERMPLGDLQSFSDADAPLTHWHITHFKQEGAQYSCIGVHYSHGVFDGLGFAILTKALQAELLGREWEVPPLPKPGKNENPVEKVVEEAAREAKAKSGGKLPEWNNFACVGAWGIICFLCFHLWQKWRYGIGDYKIILPYKVHTGLVEKTRKELEESGVKDVRLTSGDVISAWVIKSLLGFGSSPRRTLGLNNIASFRSEWSDELALYPHNAYTGIPLPMLTFGDVAKLPIHELALIFAKSRAGSRVPDAVALWNLLDTTDKKKVGAVIPEHSIAQESLSVSNVSIARFTDMDWSGAGGGRVVGYYRMWPNAQLKLVNMVGIAGRLTDGDLVITVVANRRRGERLRTEVEKLIERFQG
ncbi:hypothetical protein CC2G_013711 [Coprinopsis cinerea AmutBmut pab1-1]|nr:hypothetical protein CC2G_013711 [Coprinopsis cinerea AmutBmut pab1-1]